MRFFRSLLHYMEPETKAAAAAAASIVTTSAFGGAQSVPPTVRRFKRTS